MIFLKWLKYTDKTSTGLKLNAPWHFRQFLYSSITPAILIIFGISAKIFTEAYLEEELKFLKHQKTRMLDSYSFTNSGIPSYSKEQSNPASLSGPTRSAVELGQNKNKSKSNDNSDKSNNDINTSEVHDQSVKVLPSTSDSSAATQTSPDMHNRLSKKESEAMTIYEDLRLLHRDIDRVEQELTSIYLELLYTRQERAFLKSNNTLPFDELKGKPPVS
jgi:hypothetical protein